MLNIGNNFYSESKEMISPNGGSLSFNSEMEGIVHKMNVKGRNVKCIYCDPEYITLNENNKNTSGWCSCHIPKNILTYKDQTRYLYVIDIIKNTLVVVDQSKYDNSVFAPLQSHTNTTEPHGDTMIASSYRLDHKSNNYEHGKSTVFKNEIGIVPFVFKSKPYFPTNKYQFFSIESTAGELSSGEFTFKRAIFEIDRNITDEELRELFGGINTLKNLKLYNQQYPVNVTVENHLDIKGEPINLTEKNVTLSKIRDIFDEYNLINNKITVTKRIGQKILTGDEVWTLESFKSAAGNNIYSTEIENGSKINLNKSNTINGFNFIDIPYNELLTNESNYFICIYDNKLYLSYKVYDSIATMVSDLKNMNSQNRPISVNYILENYETINVELNQNVKRLYTHKGTNIIQFNSLVAPSEFSLTYSTPKKIATYNKKHSAHNTDTLTVNNCRAGEPIEEITISGNTENNITTKTLNGLNITDVKLNGVSIPGIAGLIEPIVKGQTVVMKNGKLVEGQEGAVLKSLESTDSSLPSLGCVYYVEDAGTISEKQDKTTHTLCVYDELDILNKRLIQRTAETTITGDMLNQIPNLLFYETHPDSTVSLNPDSALLVSYALSKEDFEMLGMDNYDDKGYHGHVYPTANIVSNQYVYNYNKSGIIFYHKFGLHITIEKNRLSSVSLAGFIDYLNNNPLTIRYPLMNPIIHELTETQVNSYSSHFKPLSLYKQTLRDNDKLYIKDNKLIYKQYNKEIILTGYENWDFYNPSSKDNTTLFVLRNHIDIDAHLVSDIAYLPSQPHIYGDTDYTLKGYCSHFKYQVQSDYDIPIEGQIHLYGNTANHDDRIAIWIDKNIASNIDEFRQWLMDQYNAGTPVKIVYECAEPTEYVLGTINNAITSLDGTNTLTVESTLTPSLLTMTPAMKTKRLLESSVLKTQEDNPVKGELIFDTELDDVALVLTNNMFSVKNEPLYYVIGSGRDGNDEIEKILTNYKSTELDFSVNSSINTPVYLNKETKTPLLLVPSGNSYYNSDSIRGWDNLKSVCSNYVAIFGLKEDGKLIYASSYTNLNITHNKNFLKETKFNKIVSSRLNLAGLTEDGKVRIVTLDSAIATVEQSNNYMLKYKYDKDNSNYNLYNGIWEDENIIDIQSIDQAIIGIKSNGTLKTIGCLNDYNYNKNILNMENDGYLVLEDTEVVNWINVDKLASNHDGLISLHDGKVNNIYLSLRVYNRDKIMDAVKKWDNLVDIAICEQGINDNSSLPSSAEYMTPITIIGVKADGTCVSSTSLNPYETDEVVKEFTNVIEVSSSYYNIYLKRAKPIKTTYDMAKEYLGDTIASLVPGDSNITNKVYGIRVDINNTDSDAACTYTDDACTMTPMCVDGIYNENLHQGSWTDELMQNLIGCRPCILEWTPTDDDNAQNTHVLGYLDPNDYSKWINGRPNDIIEPDKGINYMAITSINVDKLYNKSIMIEFDKVYVYNRVDTVNNVAYIKYSKTKHNNDWVCHPAFMRYENPNGTGNLIEVDHLYISAYHIHDQIIPSNINGANISSDITTTNSYSFPANCAYSDFTMPYNKSYINNGYRTKTNTNDRNRWQYFDYSSFSFLMDMLRLMLKTYNVCYSQLLDFYMNKMDSNEFDIQNDAYYPVANNGLYTYNKGLFWKGFAQEGIRSGYKQFKNEGITVHHQNKNIPGIKLFGIDNIFCPGDLFVAGLVFTKDDFEGGDCTTATSRVNNYHYKLYPPYNNINNYNQYRMTSPISGLYSYCYVEDQLSYYYNNNSLYNTNMGILFPDLNLSHPQVPIYNILHGLGQSYFITKNYLTNDGSFSTNADRVYNAYSLNKYKAYSLRFLEFKLSNMVCKEAYAFYKLMQYK